MVVDWKPAEGRTGEGRSGKDRAVAYLRSISEADRLALIEMVTG